MREACEKLLQIQCQMPKCQSSFDIEKIKEYEEHLRDVHRRYLCELCLEKGLLLLKEQKIYRHEEYMNHKQSGDFDPEGNLLMKHPYCEFCALYFYDED